MITIHPHPGQQMSDLARTLIALTGDGEPVRSVTSGIAVSDEVALVYLTQLLSPTVAEPPTGPPPVPPRLAQVVRSAETRSGVTRPLPDPQPTARPRKRAAGSLARTEEADRG